jgi:F-type H+-transporting ATPase subunit delta
VENSGGIQASLSGRYATALFGLALEQKKIDAVGVSLNGFARALGESADLKMLTTGIAQRCGKGGCGGCQSYEA